MQRIGILGGTFNPFHIGHLAIAQKAQEQFGLDKVIFVPSHIPPHKKIINLAPAQDRYKMAAWAIKDNPLFGISDVEIKREGKSYTIDTLKYFRDILPKNTKLFFIVGEDTFPTLAGWKDIQEILKLVTFIVVNRPGYKKERSPIKHLSVTMHGINISSSYLRRRIAQGKSIKYLVPESVFRYIEEHKLYKTII